jgi:hypothetical protein
MGLEPTTFCMAPRLGKRTREHSKTRRGNVPATRTTSTEGPVQCAAPSSHSISATGFFSFQRGATRRRWRRCASEGSSASLTTLSTRTWSIRPESRAPQPRVHPTRKLRLPVATPDHHADVSPPLQPRSCAGRGPAAAPWRRVGRRVLRPVSVAACALPVDRCRRCSPDPCRWRVTRQR